MHVFFIVQLNMKYETIAFKLIELLNLNNTRGGFKNLRLSGEPMRYSLCTDINVLTPHYLLCSTLYSPVNAQLKTYISDFVINHVKIEE